MLTPLLLSGLLVASPTPAPAEVLGQLFAAFNRHDAAALQALYAPTAMLRSADFCTPRSGAEVKRTYEALFRAVPDIRDEPETVIIDGTRAAVRFRSLGTGLNLRLMTFFRFEQGRIVEDDTLFDTGGRPCEP